MNLVAFYTDDVTGTYATIGGGVDRSAAISALNAFKGIDYNAALDIISTIKNSILFKGASYDYENTSGDNSYFINAGLIPKAGALQFSLGSWNSLGNLNGPSANFTVATGANNFSGTLSYNYNSYNLPTIYAATSVSLSASRISPSISFTNTVLGQCFLTGKRP